MKLEISSLMEQSFKESIKEEITAYYKLVAALEPQIKSDKMTLRKMLVWIAEPLRRMKYLLTIIDQKIVNSTDEEAKIKRTQALSRNYTPHPPNSPCSL